MTGTAFPLRSDTFMEPPQGTGGQKEGDAMNEGTTRIFAGAGAARSQNGTTTRGGLFRRSANEGDWEALVNGIPAGAEFHAIMARPDAPNVIFAGTNDGPYRSTDGGDHWHKLGTPSKSKVVRQLSRL